MEYEVGSGNVYADIGVPNAEEMVWKAQIVSKIETLIKERGLSQIAAAKSLGLEPTRLSEMLRGQFREMPIEHLLRFLTALDQDVRITISGKRPTKHKATIRIVTR